VAEYAEVKLEPEAWAECHKGKLKAVERSPAYQYDLPNYRLTKIQSEAGIGLPESTQSRMITQVAASIIPTAACRICGKPGK
jgi:hypothetical protein